MKLNNILTISIVIAISLSSVLSTGQIIEKGIQKEEIKNTKEIEKVSYTIETPLVTILVNSSLSTYEDLISRILRYSEDVQETLKVSTEIIYIDESWTPSEIKNLLQNKYNNNTLIGSIFIGNLPVIYLNTSYGECPTLYQYAELDGIEGQDIWIGLIKPPISGSESISLLNNYFDKNHDFHTGKLVFDKTCLYASTFENNTILSERVLRSGRWSPDRIIGTETNSVIWKMRYLNDITKSSELIHYGGHGSTTGHEFHISYTDIQNNPPNAAIIYLATCSNGEFTSDNYIGGWYLFSGNTLAVLAHTCAVWGTDGGGWGEDNCIQLPSLAGGTPFGKACLASHCLHEASVILGDPTIKLPMNRPSNSNIFSPDLGPIVLERENESVTESLDRDHIISADFNGDNKVDIISQNTLYINNGFEEYYPFIKAVTNLYGKKPYAVDFDNDGDIDIITAGENISVFTNDGNGNFSRKLRINTYETDGICAHDFDEDGDVDFIGTRSNGEVIFYNNSNSNFIESNLHNIGNSIHDHSIVAFDYDNDGDYDCAIQENYNLNFFENLGNGKFNLSKKSIDGYAHSLASGDFDNDDDIDLFVNGMNYGYRLLINKGKGIFQDIGSIINFTDVFLCNGIAADDFDNDGRVDILLTHYDGIHFKKNYFGYDCESPNINITKPEKALYLFNMKIRNYLIDRMPLVIGRINISVDAKDDDSGVNRVEFYIDDKLMGNDTTEPYSFIWNDRTILKHKHTIKIIVYDNEGNCASDEITVWKFF